MKENLTFLLIQNTNHIYLTVMYNILMYHWYFFACCNKTILFDIGKEEAILPPLFIHQTPGPPLPSSTTNHPAIQPTRRMVSVILNQPEVDLALFCVHTRQEGLGKDLLIDSFS